MSERIHTPVDLLAFVARPVAEPRWAVQDFWPLGASGIIGGMPKAGKSTIATELAVSLATGTPMFGQGRFPTVVAPARVLYVQRENTDHRVVHDLQRIMAARGLGVIEMVDRIQQDDGTYADITAFVWDQDGWWQRTLGASDGPDMEVLSHEPLDLTDPRDQAWLMEAAAGRDYVFLDPLYLLATVDERDSAALVPVLSFLTRLRDDHGCGVVLTHHMTDKRGDKATASKMLGSTYLHAWYDAAVWCTRAPGNQFKFTVDALRDHGVETTHHLRGEGVGSWTYSAAAQGAAVTDILGREQPQSARKVAGKERMMALLAEHPDWSGAALGEALGVERSTALRWRKEIEAERAEQAAVMQ